MQKLLKDYLDDFNKKQKKNRRAAVAAVLLVVMVVGSVLNILTQYGVAMTGAPVCGLEEHTHGESCYTSVLSCGQDETEGHTHTEDCLYPEELVCGEEEGEEHTHSDGCYAVPDGYACGQEESEGHTHSDGCYTSELTCGLKEHTHTDACYAAKEEAPDAVSNDGNSSDGSISAEGSVDGSGSETADSGSAAEGEAEASGDAGEDTAAGTDEIVTEDLNGTAEGITGAETDGTAGTVQEDKKTDGTEAADGTEETEESSGDDTEEEGPDPEADVESPEDWDAQYEDVEWQDVWGEDLVTAAKVQVGYQESGNNYIVAEDESHKGYTRYGHFADENGWYMDWDAAFVNFCLHYAGISDSGLFPAETDAAEWRNRFEEIIDETRGEEEHYLTGPGAYEPRTGDLVFFHREEEETEEQMGIVSSWEEETNEITVIEGNSGNEVRENTYSAADEQISAYLKLTKLEAAYKGILTPEEQEQVDAVTAMIEALPAPEVIMERFAALEEEEDEEGYAAYYLELLEQVTAARKAYEALSEKQKAAVPNGEKLKQYEWLLADTMEEAGSVWDVMGPDEAYVNKIEITSIKTGTEYFDKTEGPGNDTTADDRIVRTFDAVTYNFSVNMKSWTPSKSYSQARVKLEFVLPLTEKEAVFDQTAMAWMDQTEGYKPELTTEKRTIGDVEKDCQILTCYKLLLPSSGNQSVVPGDFGENVTINVRAMKNGETFAPMFSAAMEGGAWDRPCKNHKINGEDAIEKQTVTAERVKVTAAPRYNVHVEGNYSYKEDFNFQGDEKWMETYGSIAANTGISAPVPGRIMKMGITLQLYNDNESKGLKGIELPQRDITFDLEVSSRYTINQPASGYSQGQSIDTSEAYRPLLWSYGLNNWTGFGKQNTDGRVLYDQLGCTPHAPYSTGGGDYACHQSGTWTARQDRATGKICITVSGYEIDVNQMPIKNGDSSSGSYGANVGCFSSGAIWIVQPFNTITGNEHGTEPNFDVVKTYGEGAFTTTVKDVNLRATTLSGVDVEEGQGGFRQMAENDDELVRTLELTLPGKVQNRIRYCSATDPGKGSGVDDNRDGRDYAAVGSELYLMGGFSYDAKREDGNQLYLGTNLTKFYGSAIELQEGEWYPDFVNGAQLGGKTGDAARSNIRIRYATKKDGKDWKNDEELLNTYEEDLRFYESLKEIPDNSVCVGILFTFIGPGAPADANDPYYNCFYKAKVRDNMDLAGKTFMLASTSRVWTKGMYEQDHHSLDNIPDWTSKQTSLWSFPAHNWHYKSANIGDDTWYKKETYKPDGSGIYGTHNSDWSHWGDTLLVIGYKTKVSKYLMQKDNGGGDKKTFNLDADQRVVDFKLEPGIYYDQPGQFNNTATVTIVDTLPKYLTYKPGSAYFGGAYEPSSVNGGTQGRIVKDSSPDAKFPDPVLKEPTEVADNPDGTQTLIWKLTDVEIGTPMAPIYYSADIGTRGNPDKDVPTGTTNLLNRVYISAPGDLRDPLTTGEKHSEAGIAVTRGSASSFGKYTKQKVADEDGQIDYVVYYNNNAETGTSLTIMDTMPMNGIHGSHFTGTYAFEEWKLDVTKCDAGKIKIYYTFDDQYKDKTTKEVKREEIESWKEASISTDGTIAIPAAADGATEVQPYPVAWAAVGTLDSGQSVSIDLKLQLNPGASDLNKTENNYFVNRLSSGDTTTTTETPTVRRTLEGLTWMDYNRDGLQDSPETEIRISGVKVELLKLKEGGNPNNEDSYENVCYQNTNIPISIETGKQISVRAEKEAGAADYELGRYKFTDLPAGTYAVRFTDGNGGTKITELSATSVDSGEDDTRDSDAFASRDETGRLLKTTILNLEMPKAEDMHVSLFESRFHDSGFYPETQMTLQKVGEKGEPLPGATFTIQDDTGETLSFIYDEKRGYTPCDEEGEEFRKDKYYIALASNPYYVIGINGTDNGSLAILQNRTGNANQLFGIQRDGELCSFLNAASGKWLDLDNGICEKGRTVHVWTCDAPNDNQKWYVTGGDAGSRISTYKGAKDQWSLDVSGGTVQENQRIQLWESNTTTAQKWVLIPAGITAETCTDLNVDGTSGVTINNLKPGDYTITELRSPAGHSLLGEPVHFTVNGDGSVESNDTMAEAAGNVLTVRNNELYELPSAGGIGTYWYTVSGSLLMMAGALILYKKKMRGGAGRIGR